MRTLLASAATAARRLPLAHGGAVRPGGVIARPFHYHGASREGVTPMSQISVPVSYGEPSTRSPSSHQGGAHPRCRVANVRTELEPQRHRAADAPAHRHAAERAQLKEVNEALWDIEDRIRVKEKAKAFDAEFIELARSVYVRNDERAQFKRAINEKLGSTLVEEKSYEDYR